mgnify:CR=1 FL=1
MRMIIVFFSLMLMTMVMVVANVPVIESASISPKSGKFLALCGATSAA